MPHRPIVVDGEFGLFLPSSSLRELADLIERAHVQHLRRGAPRILAVDELVTSARYVAAIFALGGSDLGPECGLRRVDAAGFVGTGEVARLRGVRPRSIVKAIAKGKFPGATRGSDGRQWRIPVGEVG